MKPEEYVRAAVHEAISEAVRQRVKISSENKIPYNYVAATVTLHLNAAGLVAKNRQESVAVIEVKI